MSANLESLSAEKRRLEAAVAQMEADGRRGDRERRSLEQQVCCLGVWAGEAAWAARGSSLWGQAGLQDVGKLMASSRTRALWCGTATNPAASSPSASLQRRCPLPSPGQVKDLSQQIARLLHEVQVLQVRRARPRGSMPACIADRRACRCQMCSGA